MHAQPTTTTRLIMLLAFGILLLTTACGGGSLPQVTPTLSTATDAPTNTLEYIYSPTPTQPASATHTPTPTGTPTLPPSATPTITATPSVTPTPAPNARVSVGRGGLRLRALPSQNGDILDSLDELQPLYVVGRSANNTWLQVITTGGASGWVMGEFVTLDVSLDEVSVIDAEGDVITQPEAVPQTDAQVAPGGGGLRLRATPDDNSAILASLEEFDPLSIVGRTADNRWLQVVTPDEQLGWVWARYVEVYIDLSSVQVGAADILTISSEVAIPSPVAMATIVAAQGTTAPAAPRPNAQVEEGRSGLRVRDTPGTAGIELVRLAELADLVIIGRTADNRWLQVITPEGNTGWVWAGYVEVFVDLNQIPVSGEAINATPGPVQVAGAPGNTPPPVAPVQMPDGVITGITNTARQIFLQGQSMGNRPNVFSKVGDSITDVGYFLNPIGYGNYNLNAYQNLAPVVNYFMDATARDNNSFANDSMAANPGWTTVSMFTPGLAPDNVNSTECQPGEFPLYCEFRIVRPAIALIMLGTNDVDFMSVGEYSSLINSVVQATVDLGIIPVLSTIPPREGADQKVAQFNQVIIDTARRFDIPLWDYWSVMNSLPNRGLSGDGVHPSVPPDGNPANFSAENLQYGYTMRNLTALQVLDAIWRQVMY